MLVRQRSSCWVCPWYNGLHQKLHDEMSRQQRGNLRRWLSYSGYPSNPPKSSTTAASTTSSTISRTTSIPTTAISTPTVASIWTFKGCYVDVVPPVVVRTLYKTAIIQGSLTIEACQKTCWEKGFPYGMYRISDYCGRCNRLTTWPLAGVEVGRECYCGSSIRNALATDTSTTCTSRCTGNSNQLCGGSNRIHVYERRIETSANKDTLNHLGCYSDPVNPRALDTLINVPGGGINMTIGNCLTAAKAVKAIYAGVENANERWTGNTIKGPTNALSECNKPCNRDKTEICGGRSRLKVYQNVIPKTNWLPLGCYTTSSSVQTLSVFAPSAAEDNKLTNESCKLVCSARGYNYAGVTGGNQCFCDSSIRGGSLDTAGASACNVPCTGHSTQICGATNRLSVFLQASF